MLYFFVLAASGHPPGDGELPGEVVVRLPIPVARPVPGDASFCFVVSPTLQTSHTVFEGDGVQMTCASSPTSTFVCLTVAADAAWPDPTGGVTCQGVGHVLRATFVPGHDPHDDPIDGVEVVKVGGPMVLHRDRTVTFVAPGWPDGEGTMPDGHCHIEDGRLTLSFRQPLYRKRLTCRIGDRAIPIRLRRPQAWAP